MILLLPFLILGEKEVPRRGMSGNEGLGGTLPQKSCLGEEGLLSDSPRHAIACHLLRCRSGRRPDCVPLAHGALMEGGLPTQAAYAGEKPHPRLFCHFCHHVMGVFPGKRTVFFVIFIPLSWGCIPEKRPA